MKTYEIRKRVRAKDAHDAMRKEKKVKADYIVWVIGDDEQDDDEEEEFENGKIYGFRRK